jgi:hypothetical protein
MAGLTVGKFSYAPQNVIRLPVNALKRRMTDPPAPVQHRTMPALDYQRSAIRRQLSNDRVLNCRKGYGIAKSS